MFNILWNIEFSLTSWIIRTIYIQYTKQFLIFYKYFKSLLYPYGHLYAEIKRCGCVFLKYSAFILTQLLNYTILVAFKRTNHKTIIIYDIVVLKENMWEAYMTFVIQMRHIILYNISVVQFFYTFRHFPCVCRTRYIHTYTVSIHTDTHILGEFGRKWRGRFYGSGQQKGQ